MRIAYLAAGAAGMYCGACLHDNTLAAALLRLGEDVLLVPTYTPLRTDEEDVSQKRVFFGGINVYLKQRFPFYRRVMWPIDAVLDSPALIKLVTKLSSSVDASKLGDLTESILRGEEGHQRKELEQLVDWLAQEVRPQVVHLTNAMLMGFARMIRERTGAPVVCSLAGEDVFLERVVPPYYQRCRDLLRERARDVDAFTALNRYYADFMIDYADLDPARVHVIPHGLNLEGHGTRDNSPRGAFRIGYLARINHDKGLHILAEAFRLLHQRPGLPPLELHAAGYLHRGERGYLRGVERSLARAGLKDRFRYLGEPDRAGKIQFLQSLDVMSVPAVYRESKGLSVLEALLNAVPVVLPDHGAYPEMIAATGGGRLCRPEDPQSLADSLFEMIQDRIATAQLGLAAQRVMREEFNAEKMARRTLALYQSVSGANPDIADQQAPGPSAETRP